MRTFLLIYIFPAFSCSIYAQTDSVSVGDTSKIEGLQLHDARLIVKTDALSIFNSCLSEGTFDAYVAGEMNLSQRYGLQLNTSFERVINTMQARTGFRIGAEFKRYLPCNSYAILFTGAYFNFENVTTTIDRLRHENKFLKYRESGFEIGMSGGVQAIINKHWVICPSAYAGISTIYLLRIIEARNTSHMERPAELMVSVMLGIGYKF